VERCFSQYKKSVEQETALVQNFVQEEDEDSGLRFSLDVHLGSKSSVFDVMQAASGDAARDKVGDTCPICWVR